MKNYSKFTYLLAIWIIVLFSFAMASTYLSEYLQQVGFFGDTIFVKVNSWDNNNSIIDEAHIWGVRHYWYWWMCAILWILSVVRMIMWADHFWTLNKYYK